MVPAGRAAVIAEGIRGRFVTGVVLALLATLALGACGSGGGTTTTAAGTDCQGERLDGEGDLCGDPGDERAQTAIRVAREVQVDDGLPAVEIGLWDDGKEIVTAAMGEALPGVPATRDDHFRIGNVTESFTVTLLLKLAEEGRLSLDDPVSKWYPDLPHADEVTLEMLAASISGYPDYVTNPKFGKALNKDPFQEWTAEELLDYGFSQPEVFPPGKSWAFSDTNFVLLGDILSQVTGGPVNDALDEYVYAPLDLEDTAMWTTPPVPSPALHGYTNERGVTEDATNWNPTWSLYTANMTSNLHDLGRFAQALGTGELLPDELHQKQIGPTNVGLGPLTEDRYYALGVGVSNGWIVTNPQIPGYNGILGYLPEEDLAVVIYNTLGTKSDPAVHYATRIMLRLTDQITPDHVPELSDRPRG